MISYKPAVVIFDILISLRMAVFTDFEVVTPSNFEKSCCPKTFLTSELIKMARKLS